jgi:hypothetical protein
MSEPVKIMLDGMTEKPIAIPFPFSIGGWIISDPDDWHSFKRINADLEFHADNRLVLLKRIEKKMVFCLECGGRLTNFGKAKELKGMGYEVGHTDDCELAEELGDD